MSKPRSHRLDVYGAWLHVATDQAAWRRIRKRIIPTLPKDPGGLGATCLTLQETPDGKVVPHLTVWLDVGATESQRDKVSLITHEAAHAGLCLLDHVGQKYDGESEAMAYLIDFIAGWLWEACS